MIEQGLIIEIPNELSKGKQYREDKRTKRTYEITERGINIVRYFRDGKKMTNFNMLDIY
jgi:predicted transcriptional regulator